MHKLLTTLLGMLLNPTITHARVSAVQKIDTDTTTEFKDAIILESPILELIDGVTFCIDGYAIKDMKRMCRIIKLLQYGSYNTKTGILTGRYHFDNKTYGLHELAQIEQEVFAQARVKKTPELARKIEELLQILKQAKQDFGRIVEPFLETIQGTKSFITVLITQSCQKRNRADSYLHDWAKCKGNERESFEEHVQSLNFLNTFFTDLYNFLTDFQASCPLGCRKYAELMAKEQAESISAA